MSNGNSHEKIEKNVGLMAVLIALQLVVNWIIAIWGVTMLTSLYGYFAENRNF